MASEQKQTMDMKLEDYKMMLIAAHPENAQKYLNLFKPEAEKEWESVPIQEVTPLSDDPEIEGVIDQLRHLGWAETED